MSLRDRKSHRPNGTIKSVPNILEPRVCGVDGPRRRCVLSLTRPAHTEVCKCPRHCRGRLRHHHGHILLVSPTRGRLASAALAGLLPAAQGTRSEPPERPHPGLLKAYFLTRLPKAEPSALAHPSPSPCGIKQDPRPSLPSLRVT